MSNKDVYDVRSVINQIVDRNRNEIDYNSVFNSLIFVSETRFNKIKEHVEKLHKFQGEKLTKDWFIRYIKKDNHPE